MKGKNATVALAATILVNPACADFLGWESQWILLGSGRLIGNIYAVFSNPGDRALAIYDSHIEFNRPFFQSASRPFWQADDNQNKNTSEDSWVNIGSNPTGNGFAGGNGGLTLGDEDFVNFTDAQGATDFSIIQNSGEGAGWYNANPSNGYGYATEGFDTSYGQFFTHGVLMAHIVFSSSDPTPWPTIYWSGSLAVQLAGSAEVTYGVGADMPRHLTFVPAPASLAIAVLAAGMCRRTRARRRP